MIISVSFWAAIRQLQTIVIYFHGRGLVCIRHSSGTQVDFKDVGADKKFVFENIHSNSLKISLQCLLVFRIQKDRLAYPHGVLHRIRKKFSLNQINFVKC